MTRRMMIAAACLLAAACQQQGDDANRGGNGQAASRTAPSGGGEQAKQSLAEGLAASPDHAQLVNALRAAGLEETLSGAQPYTIFAPTDAAFQKLQAGGGDALLAPENKAGLVSLLTGHIVPGLVTAEDLRNAVERGKGKAQLATVGGGTLSFTGSGDDLTVAGPGGVQARVSGAEKLQSNGAIHPIDTVLAPR